jgi:hypothetical protein
MLAHLVPAARAGKGREGSTCPEASTAGAPRSAWLDAVCIAIQARWFLTVAARDTVCVVAYESSDRFVLDILFTIINLFMKVGGKGGKGALGQSMF